MFKRIVGKFYKYSTQVVVGTAGDLEKLGNQINEDNKQSIAYIVPLGVMPNGDIAVWIQTKQEVD